MPPANARQKAKKKTGDSSPPHRDGRGVAPGLCKEYPMTEEPLQPHFAAAFSLAVSAPRFAAFQKDGNEREALARYLWNVALCEALYPAFHTLEVGFRNAVHRELGVFHGAPTWLISHHAFLKVSEQDSIRSAETSLLRHHKPVTEPRLIAELSFGFWTSLLDRRYDQIWPQIIRRVFPLMPRKMRTRANISAMMQPIRRLRNLAFHHHAIWDRTDLGATHTSAITLIGWMSGPLVASLGRIDRFPAILSGGLEPYLEHASQLMPHPSLPQ